MTDRGASLPEFLVALLLMGILAAGAHRFCQLMMGTVCTLDRAAEAEQSAELVLDVLRDDLRSAGYAPRHRLRPPLARASRNALSLVRDLNGDGDHRDANEEVAYRFDERGKRLLRRMGNAPPQPMLDGLTEDGLVFHYYDADSRRIPASRRSLDARARGRVRRIDIVLSLALPNPGPVGTKFIRAVHTTTVALRNAD